MQSLRKKDKTTGFNPRQQAFIDYYLELGNGTQAAIKAGYKATNADRIASEHLRKPHIQAEIARRTEEIQNGRIATAQQVMEYFTQVMNGEIKDQFGLEASLAERTKAAQELAKRTVDIENRAKGKADAVVEIKLDWSRD